jgi:hypothetical protein
VILTDVPEDSAAVTEETFGPTITVRRVANLEEGVQLANASRYGLGSSVFARSRRRARAAARELYSGMTAINSVMAFAGVPALPFGGVGEFGRIHGADGLREFARAKAIASQWSKSVEEAAGHPHVVRPDRHGPQAHGRADHAAAWPERAARGARAGRALLRELVSGGRFRGGRLPASCRRVGGSRTGADEPPRSIGPRAAAGDPRWLANGASRPRVMTETLPARGVFLDVNC